MAISWHADKDAERLKKEIRTPLPLNLLFGMLQWRMSPFSHHLPDAELRKKKHGKKTSTPFVLCQCSAAAKIREGKGC
jgi:hypothetical protein